MAEYIAALNVVDDENTVRTDALFAGITDENDVNQTRNAFSKLPDELERAASAAEDLNPPTEAQAKHDALVKALNEFADAMQDSADAAADATSVEEYFTAVESDAFTAADEGFTAACLDMQNLAKDNGITVDLGCGGDEDGSADGASRRYETVAAGMERWKDIEAFAAACSPTLRLSYRRSELHPAKKCRAPKSCAGLMGASNRRRVHFR